MKLTNHSDAQLAVLACQGNQSAFLVLYDRHKAGVQAHVLRYITQREEAEDVMLESFQKAFSQIDSYDPTYKFSTWLYRIARNTAFDHMDKSGRFAIKMPMDSLDNDLSLKELAIQDRNPEHEVINSQEYDELVAAINGLPETYREVAQLVFLDNFGYQEVADKTGLPLNTIKTKVKRAKENLIKKMDENEENI